MSEEIDNLNTWLKRDFPLDVDALHQLCVNEAGFPIGYYHVDILLGCLEGVGLSDNLIEQLRAPYVYLSAYYFSLDAVVDDHEISPGQPLLLTHFIAAAISGFSEVYHFNLPGGLSRFRYHLLNYVSANARATQEERLFSANPFSPCEQEEFASIVGRSNSFLLLLEILSDLTNAPIKDELRSMIERFLFLMQLGDDMGDWRSDFRASHWTSFLRLCFFKAGRMLTEGELEEIIYLEGLYEWRGLWLVREFDSLLATLKQAPVTKKKFFGFVQKQRDRLYSVLQDFIQTKVDAAS